jgi:hypothetical protein
MPTVVSALAVDCRDPDTLGVFWQALLGGELVLWPQFGVVALRAPGITFDFTLVPEAKESKNRLHLDLATEEPATTTARAIELGATVTDEFEKHTVMRDPEGNEFCILHEMPADRPWQPPN